MKAKQLLETYPEIAVLIREWFGKVLLRNLKNEGDIPDKYKESFEDFKKTYAERGVTDSTLILMIDKNPASLFEFFDSVGVYVGISLHNVPEIKKVVFNYYICPDGNCSEDTEIKDFFTRKDAEYWAVLDAMEYIDKNIVNGKDRQDSGTSSGETAE